MHRFSVLSAFCATALLVLSCGGCRVEENIPLDVPDGWESDGGRWWIAGEDTSAAFRDLETLSDMGIVDARVDETRLGSGDAIEEAARKQLATYVKESLIQLFRNHPEVVDSLFDRHVAPRMAGARIHGDVRPVVNEFKKEGYRTISRHFRQPFSITKLGVDVPLLFPDSLRTQEISGEVFLQIYISEDGKPLAIRRLRGVHPVLDRIAMRAMTEMRWQPAYVVQGLKSPAIRSWARYTVRFASPGEG